MMKQVYKIQIFEGNGDLPRRLIVVVPKKKGILSRLETK